MLTAQLSDHIAAHVGREHAGGVGGRSPGRFRLQSHDLPAAHAGACAVHMLVPVCACVPSSTPLSQLRFAPPDELVDIHVHELKHQRQAPRGLVIQHLKELDDIGVRAQPPQRLQHSAAVAGVRGKEGVASLAAHAACK